MRLFGLKYVSPLRYIGTKLIANAIHSTLNPRGMPRVPDVLRPRPYQGDLFHPPVSLARPKSAPVARREPERVEKMAEWQPVFNHAKNRPPAVKRNGGLRGSTATKWRA